MSTLAKNKLKTSPDIIQPRNALDKKCTQITPGTRLSIDNLNLTFVINIHVNLP